MKKIFTMFVVSAGLVTFGASESSASSSTYTIEKGDTLSEIAVSHNVSVGDLYEWNDLQSTVIYPNQKLTISEAKEAKQYTIKKGDTLYKIANMYNVSVADLMAKNNLISTIIYPNQKLQVDSIGSPAKTSTAKATETPAKKTAVTKASKKVDTPSRSTSEKATKEFTVTATAYTAYCNGCSGITKTGINLKQNPDLKVIAVDPSVIPLGTKVHVEGYGYAIAGDIGGAIKGNKIDVFIPTQSEALNWGRKDVKIKILD
ncbi:LysM peptidoglycan-binding and 3D domain-containing protein [Sporosarcina sp. Marseille-Q4063]|uniref:LysM peptidoglycan-binding and 3D domain-containing protein n=1 Tax=Sporosarcina sp. Marseille-Q4063 TaxID=2810514 RepID=UPI0020169D5C|nr:3D domain-containing protein [Sporosarcina sp. Marseille-Q4063]